MKPFSKDIREKKISELCELTLGDSKHDRDYLDEYLNINALNLDLTETIYRIFDWKYFIKDLNTTKLTLPQTKSWLKRDPYENLILNSEVSYHGESGKIGNIYYGSCWTLLSDCDGMWRNFKADENSCAVKVKTNAKKLITAIYDINDFAHDNRFFIGKVKYVKEQYISELFKRTYKMDELDDGFVFLEYLFIKRQQFKYEHEIRVIIKGNDDKRTIRIPFDPNLLIEEIVLDPAISNTEFLDKKKQIENAGYQGPILHSNLYSRPPHFILNIQ